MFFINVFKGLFSIYLYIGLFSTMECNWIAYVGLASVSYIGLRLLYDICSGIKLYLLSPTPKFHQYGQWSVITGATDGIGKATAK